MALVLYDRVQETTATTGTGSITLGGAVAGYQSFAVVGNGNTTFYCILNGSAWEVGIGTYSTTGPTLARTTILSNSNGNTSPITLSGASSVFITYPSEKSINYDANGNVNISYTPNTTTSVGKLNVGDNTYSQSLTGQIAVFAGADSVSSNLYLVNTNNTSNTSYSSIVTGANNYASVYMEMGTNSSLYSYSAAGYANNALNQPNNSFLQAYGSDLVLSTWTSNAIHFVQNASSATSDSMTLFADGGASLGGLGDPGLGNIAINNAVVGFTAITSAAGTTVLTSSSTQVQAVTGTTTQTIQLPQATTLLKGTFYTISNISTGLVTVKDNAGTTLETITTGGAAQFLCISNLTSAGTWGVRVFASSNTTWGNTALNYGGNITGATWQANTIATGYGGTGLITFTAANNALYSTSSSTLTAGTLPVAAGGTGATTLTGYVYGNGTSAMTASTTIPTSALTGNFVSTFSAGTTGLTPSTATTGAVTLAGTLGVANGGTGVTTTPTNGQLLVGNGTNYTVASLGSGTGISTTTGSGTLTINNTGVTSVIAGTGISVSGATGAVTITSSVTSPIPSGSVMLFYQSAAPTGWTQVTTTGLDDSALRITTSTGGSTGGTTAFSTVFANQTPSFTPSNGTLSVSAGTLSVGIGSLATASTTATGSVNLSSGGSVNLSGGGSVNGTTLSTAQIPSHSHGVATYAQGAGGGTQGVAACGDGNGIYGDFSSDNTGSGGSHSHGFNNPTYSLSNPSYSFSGTGHTHTITGSPSLSGAPSLSGTVAGSVGSVTLNVKYLNVIICSKN